MKAANKGYRLKMILIGLFENSGKRWTPLAYNPDFTVFV